MRYLYVLVWIFGFCTASFTQERDVPEWIDTTAPVINVEPTQRYHNRLFHVTLTANELSRIRYAIDIPERVENYEKPLTIVEEGKTVVYFQAEDAIGNTTPWDSVVYILDASPPALSIDPKPGQYSQEVTVVVEAGEPCQLFRHTGAEYRSGIPFESAFTVVDSFTGYVTAVDQAGNVTTSRLLKYFVDTSSVDVTISPPDGIFNEIVSLKFKTSSEADVYYTFDPLAPAKWFKKYTTPVDLPHGRTLVRYFARNEFKQESRVKNASFVVDTVAPVVKIRHKRGRSLDTIQLYTKDSATITYSLDESAGAEENVYTGPFTVPHRGRIYVRAAATDPAGNVSGKLVWEYRYDHDAPIVTPSKPSGKYSSPFTLTFTVSEPAKILYTLNGRPPLDSGQVYSEGIPITRNGETTVRYIGIDRAGNHSESGEVVYVLDIRPPTVRARIEGTADSDLFEVRFEATEESRVYYEVGTADPTTSSTRYQEPFTMHSGQSLRYFAVDQSGNRSKVFRMNDLTRPVVTVSPEGGMYSRRVPLRFTAGMNAIVEYRILPDTVFRVVEDSVYLRDEGLHTVEFYAVSSAGLRSSISRMEYLLDWTAPETRITLRKGVEDTVILFYECTENATIYYTTDGRNPMFSSNISIVGDRNSTSTGRIVLDRQRDAQFAFYAEDIAGNQSTLSFIDLLKPEVVPNIPANTNQVYDRMLSITLSSYDERARVYYERNGRNPDLSSKTFENPITLMASDTITAFAIDAAGYRGDPDTFTYLIDLPPSPRFTVSPDTADVDLPVTFSASGTTDRETESKRLLFRWDFDGDSVIDVEETGRPVAVHRYPDPGKYTVTLSVVDAMERVTTLSKELVVRAGCPEGMELVALPEGTSFCMDKYEWPNKKGKVPGGGYSWVQAKMHCLDEGKRLCTAEEWSYACRGGNGRAYPYGSAYQEGRCPDAGENVYRSGEFKDCGEGFGIRDMVGNLWEWIEDKDGTMPLMMGGSLGFGEQAHCGAVSVGSMTGEGKDIGFRCCK